MRIFPKGPTDADVQARVDAAIVSLLGGASFSGDVHVPTLKVEPLPGPDLVINGKFETSTGWTFGSGWVWTAGAAHKNANGSATVSQASVIPYQDGQRFFRVKFTVFDRTTGSVTPTLAGIVGTAVSTNGDYDEIIPVAWSSGSVAFTPSFSARLKITNVEVREVQAGVEMSQAGIIPTLPSVSNLGSLLQTFSTIYASSLYASNVYASYQADAWEMRGPRLTAYNSSSYLPGEVILGSGWSHGDWRLRIDMYDLVFEQYDSGTYEWIEKHRIPATG
ncbi:MAG TPA: hypothetical protein VM487_10895 [Phycisphaerae bacterium]|nr:hypothetical protein [Phycisphaerae bacterium]